MAWFTHGSTKWKGRTIQQHPKERHSGTSTPVAPDATIEEVELLIKEFKRLLKRHEDVLSKEDVNRRIATLEHWMESYHSGLAAAHKIMEFGADWLGELQGKLKLAAEELQRLEDEGGNPATREQVDREEELLKIVRRLDLVVPVMEEAAGQVVAHGNDNKRV